MSRPSIPDLLKTHELSSSAPVDPVTPTPASPQGWNRAKSSANSPVTTPVSNNQRVISDVSSFLAAKKVDPDGYPRFSKDLMRAKGLAEIVGKENFFVELHAQFCVILANLVKELSR